MNWLEMTGGVTQRIRNDHLVAALLERLKDPFHAHPAPTPVTPANTAGVATVAAAAGASAMYLLDPAHGRRRRAVARDKLIRWSRKLGHACDVAARDLFNRSRGWFARLGSLAGQDLASDRMIEERVRAGLGRCCSHPRAIQVASQFGHVTITGDCLADEHDAIVSAVEHTRGVQSLESRLHSHNASENFAMLQGGHARGGSRWMGDNWAPGARAVAMTAGAALMARCLAKRDLASALLGTAGFALFARAATNLPAGKLIGSGAGGGRVTVHKTLDIDAPIDQVFGFWANYDNFPLFMSNVKAVRDHGNGISHWVVAGPAGTTVRWDAVLTEYQPDRSIGWKSVPGASVPNEGWVKFRPNPDGGTRVHVVMHYTPPAGALGHAIAALFGADPKSEMDQDLLRLKTLIETGRFPRDASQHVEPAGTTGGVGAAGGTGTAANSTILTNAAAAPNTTVPLI